MKCRLREFNGRVDNSTRMMPSAGVQAGFTLVLCSILLSHSNHVTAEPSGSLPSFTNTPTQVNTQKGYEAVLRCGVENLGTKTVSWRKLPYNVPITVGREQFLEIERFKLHHVLHSGEWNLHIKNAQTFDSGTYECQVSLKDSKIRRNVTLSVTEFPSSEPTIDVSGTQFVEKGQPIYLTCNVTSPSPPDQIDWFKDGQRLETSYARQVYITQQLSMRRHQLSSSLEIRQARMSDSGQYVCRASMDLVTRVKVDVLNAERENEKRETPYDTDSKQGRGASFTSASAASGAPQASLPVLFAISLLLSLHHLVAVTDRATCTTRH